MGVMSSKRTFRMLLQFKNTITPLGMGEGMCVSRSLIQLYDGVAALSVNFDRNSNGIHFIFEEAYIQTDRIETYIIKRQNP